jgi:hypothetical protein
MVEEARDERREMGFFDTKLECFIYAVYLARAKILPVTLVELFVFFFYSFPPFSFFLNIFYFIFIYIFFAFVLQIIILFFVILLTLYLFIILLQEYDSYSTGTYSRAPTCFCTCF